MTSDPGAGIEERGEAPLVSIITAAYNAAQYLEETIESVLSQDYPHLEYIVLDDGSTDATPSILSCYGDRLRSDRHDNVGETRTVNIGFGLSRGEIVGVVSADDPLLPGIVTAMVRAFAIDKAAIVIYPDWEMIDENGRVLQHITTYDYNFRDMVRWHHCFPGPGTFFRRRVVTSLGGRDPRFRYVADYDFWLHAALLGPFARLPQTLACYRHHAASASVGELGPSMASEHIQMMDKFFSRRDLPGEIRKIRHEAYSSAHWVAGVVAGDDNQVFRRYHYRKAFLLAPHKYLGEHLKSRMLLTIVPAFHGERILRGIKALQRLGARLRQVFDRIESDLRA